MGQQVSSQMLKCDFEVETLNDGINRESLESLEGVFLGCDSPHREFIRMDEYTMEDLPLDIRHPTVHGIVLHNSNLTVRLYAPPSPGQREPKCGSGSVCYFSDTHNLFKCTHGDVAECNFCHIPDCPYNAVFGPDHFLITNYQRDLSEEQEARAHIAFRVSTNEHVVASCHEAARTQVEFFFDSPEHRNEVITAQGVCLCGQWREQDKVHIVCVADRTPRLQELLQTMRELFWDNINSMPKEIKDKLIYEYVILVSHPHGCSKRITFGRNLGSEKKFSVSKTPYTETFYDAPSCRGSSGGVVLGPGWVDGGPAYRVHCGRVEGKKISKSFWVVSKETQDNTANYLHRAERRNSVSSWLRSWLPIGSIKPVGEDSSSAAVVCCEEKSHKALPESV